MEFNELTSITVKNLKKNLDNKEISNIKKDAKKAGYGLDYDVEVGLDSTDGLTYVALNVSFINENANDIYVESHEVLAVDNIPNDRAEDVDSIEKCLKEIGKKMIK